MAHLFRRPGTPGTGVRLRLLSMVGSIQFGGLLARRTNSSQRKLGHDGQAMGYEGVAEVGHAQSDWVFNLIGGLLAKRWPEAALTRQSSYGVGRQMKRLPGRGMSEGDRGMIAILNRLISIPRLRVQR